MSIVKCEYAFIYDNGYSVQVRLSNGQLSGFPHLADWGEGVSAWAAAKHYAEKNAKNIEEGRPDV